MKITRKEKLEIAVKYFEEGLTLKELSLEYNYHVKNVKYVIELYRRHGEAIFLGEEEIREHTRETKLILIEKVLNENRSIRSVALEYGLMDATILEDWLKLYKNKGEGAIQTTRKRAPYKLEEERLKAIANKELKERIEYLEAENAYLKKLHSLVLSRALQKKK